MGEYAINILISGENTLSGALSEASTQVTSFADTLSTKVNSGASAATNSIKEMTDSSISSISTLSDSISTLSAKLGQSGEGATALSNQVKDAATSSTGSLNEVGESATTLSARIDEVGSISEASLGAAANHASGFNSSLLTAGEGVQTLGQRIAEIGSISTSSLGEAKSSATSLGEALISPQEETQQLGRQMVELGSLTGDSLSQAQMHATSLGDTFVNVGDSINAESVKAGESISLISSNLEQAQMHAVTLGDQFASVGSLSNQALGEAQTRGAMLNSGLQNTAKEGVGGLTNSFNSMRIAAGAAFTMAGMYLQQFLMSSIQASVKLQGTYSAMGGAMGMGATQSIAAEPQLQSEAMGWSEKTGVAPEQLASAVPTLEMIKGMSSNSALLNATMPLIGGLATETGQDPSGAAQLYLKTIAATTPSSMQMSKMGVNATELNQSSANLGYGSTFASDTPTEKVQALNAALTSSSNIMKVNAAEANSSAGKYAILTAQMEDVEGSIGNALIPALSELVSKVLYPIGEALNKYPALGTIAAGILVVGTGLTLLAGPLLALQGIGALPGMFTSLGSSLKNLPGNISSAASSIKDFVTGTKNAGDSAKTAAGEETSLGTGEKAAGSGAVTEGGEQKTLGASETLAGSDGAGSATKIDTFAGSEALAGTDGAGSATKIDTFAASEALAGKDAVPVKPGVTTEPTPTPVPVGESTTETTEAGQISKYLPLGGLVSSTLMPVAAALGGGDVLGEAMKPVYNGISEMFGQPADAFKAYGGLSNLFGMGTTPTNYESTITANAQAHGANLHSTNALQQLTNALSGPGKYIGGALGNTGKEWNRETGLIGGAYGNTVSAFTDSANRFGGAWGNTKSFIGNLGNSINSGASGFGSWVHGGLTSMFGGASAAEQPGSKNLPDTRYGDIFGKIGNIPASIKNIGPSIGNIGPSITNGMNQAKNAAQNGVNGIVNDIKTLPGKVRADLNQLSNDIKAPLTNAWNGAKTTVTAGVNDVEKTVSQLPGHLMGYIHTVESDVSSGFNSAMHSAESSVSSGISSIGSDFGKLPGLISSALSSAASTLMSWGSTLISDAKSIGSQVWSAISNVGHGKGPSGPRGPGSVGSSAGYSSLSSARGPMESFDTVATNLVRGWHYEDYAGSQKGIGDVFNDKGGNCLDTSLALGSVANMMGLPASIIPTTWNGGSHAALSVAGRAYDPAHKMISGNFGLPPRGSGGMANYGSTSNFNPTIQINGPIFGIQDLFNQIGVYLKQQMEPFLTQIEQTYDRRSMGNYTTGDY